MKLTRQEEIALLFISELAMRQDIFIPLSDIARKHNLSPLFLKKIALPLKKHAIVISKEGFCGGYKLARDPSRISAWEVMSVVSGKSDIHKKCAVPVVCPICSCLPQRIRFLIMETFKRYASDVTIDQFVKEKHI